MTTSNSGRASFSKSPSALLAIPYTITTGETKNFDLTLSSPVDSAPDPSYISSQLKSAEWLQRYGLKSQRLTFDQILQQIGFKRLESYTQTIGKTVGAKYAGNLYHEVQHDNGDRYVLTCRPEKLREYRNRLTRMLNILKKRLAYLNNGSRRIFGILGEPSICFVCDCKTFDHKIFNQFQTAIASLLKEQVSKIKRFNLIWVSDDTEQYQSQPIDVTPASVDQAIDWISDRKCARNKISVSATCEAILEAFRQNVHSIYLITEGDSSDSAREMLRDNIVKTRLSSNASKPIHVVSLFCRNNDTETFLRSIAQTADGSFVSYKIHHEVTDLKAPINVHEPTRIQLQENKIQFGNYANLPASNQPVDISLMYKEIFQCENIIERLDKILGFIRDDNSNTIAPIDTSKSLDAFDTSKQSNRTETSLQRSLIIQSSALFNNDENDMASIDWLKIYGIDAQKIDFFTVLQAVAFRHCDGVVTLYKPPETVDGARDVPRATGMEKLVNAKYCDQFAHVKWPDGTLRHVYVAPEFFRDYERKIRALLEKVRARLLWLKKGSRDVFGTVIEKKIYFLIDTSKSMQNHLTFVKEKLLLLIQEQLMTKERVNMVSFNSTINPWRDRLTRINQSGTHTQLQQWIEGLTADGSTNTLAAIRFALADPDTEAMYLLTDGRPDQNERHILSQVQYRQTIPVHTIAFNCQDATANQFLFDLSKQTGGRFHAFNYGYETRSSIELPESEDISYLKKELARGEEDLKKIGQLRDECLGRTWAKENLTSKYQSLPTEGLSSLLLPLRSRSSADLSSQLNQSSLPTEQVERPKRATTMNIQRKEMAKTASSSFHEKNRTTWNADQWLLRETVEYLDNSQHRRQKNSLRESTETPRTERATSMETSRRRLNALEEVKHYLKRNSVTARSLTILDVIHPTTSPIKNPERLQIIDRYVMAKVWDDISPFLHESYAKKFRSVNHYAFDLEKYEMTLKELIDEYSEFTSKLIWKYLSDDGKQKVASKIHWATLSDKAKEIYAKDLTLEEQTEPNALEMFVWKKLDEKEQKEYLTRPVRYNEKTASILRQALKDSDDDSVVEAVDRMETEIQRAEKFRRVSSDLRRHQKRSQPRPTDKSPVKPIRLVKSAVIRRRFGQRVLCRYDVDGYFYPGTVERDANDRSIVLFDNEIEQPLSGHPLIPYEQTNNQLRLYIHDCVLIRLTNDQEEYWLPGLVRCSPTTPCILPSQVYLIEVYHPIPEQVYAHRKDLVRISFTIFQRTVAYLEQIKTSPSPIAVPVEPVQAQQPSDESFKDIFRGLLDPLTEKIDHIDRSNKKRYNQLQETLRDHMGAIRILQQHPIEKDVRTESVQTHEIPIVQRRSSLDSTTTEATKKESLSSRSTVNLEDDTPVVAVWFDHDALAYEGKIYKVLERNEYVVERCEYPGVRSVIKRNDIFYKSNQRCLKDLDCESYALIIYPNDCRSCRCPAVILRQNESTTTVRFYDCFTDDLDNNELAIPINEQQFELYATRRIEKEKSLLGKTIVGFHPIKKVFMAGSIAERTEYGHQYKIIWCEPNQSTVQSDEHLFGEFSLCPRPRVGDYVLALNEDEKIYEPGCVKSVLRSEEKVVVEVLSLGSKADSSTPRIIELPWKFTYVITKAYLETITNRLVN